MKTNPSRSKRYLRLALIAIIGCGVSTLLGFAVYRQNHAVCKRLEIQLEEAGEWKMFSQENVAEWVREAGGELLYHRLDSIPLENIRQRIIAEDAVHSAEVYTTIDGRCVVKVKQRIPVMRVMEVSGNSYYIDSEGYPISLRNSYFRLPLYTGHIHGAEYNKSVLLNQGTVLTELCKLNEVICNSEFWMNQVEHVFVDQGGEIHLIPRVGNHRILLGREGEYAVQLSRVKLFYNHIVKHGDLNRYAAVDARFEGQIVGIKN